MTDKIIDFNPKQLNHEQKQRTFEVAVRPLMEWISENCNPHCVVTVDALRAEVFEGQLCFGTDDYIGDEIE